MKKILESDEFSAAALRKEGIYTEDGKLSKNYQPLT